MLLRHDLFPISGYIGFMKEPHASYNEMSVFCVTDQNREELNVIVLQPGSYDAVMHFATLTHFRRINIFATSLDIGFISDIYRIGRDLRRVMKQGVYTIFPEPFPMSTDPQTQMNHLKMITYTSKIDPNISVQYYINDDGMNMSVKTVHSQKTIYKYSIFDIGVYLGNKFVLLPAVMKKEYLGEYTGSSKTEIHIPYNSTLYGGLTYSDIIEGYRKREYTKAALDLCRANCFASSVEYSSCKNNGEIRMPNIIHMSLE